MPWPFAETAPTAQEPLWPRDGGLAREVANLDVEAEPVRLTSCLPEKVVLRSLLIPPVPEPFDRQEYTVKKAVSAPRTAVIQAGVHNSSPRDRGASAAPAFVPGRLLLADRSAYQISPVDLHISRPPPPKLHADRPPFLRRRKVGSGRRWRGQHREQPISRIKREWLGLPQVGDPCH